MAAVLRGSVTEADVGVLSWGGPRPGPRASSTDGDVPRARPGLGGTPRPRCPRASRPRAPSLTGAGGLRREEAEEAEEAPLLWGDPRA